ncbi:Abi family protein [Rufibacter immobilis]|uniref:Abi family protein n=1 Tax=Rufibacter immobilis TaxID=1348778 RepID=UPI0035EFD80A
MTFQEIERLLSSHRMAKYLIACNTDQDKALELYRANLRLSYELFAVTSMFEVVLRNKIDQHYKTKFLASTGSDQWLETQTEPEGCFHNNPQVEKTFKNISEAKAKLKRKRKYTHDKLVAELTFGFWRYLFASKEFMAAGSTLHQIFVNRPHNTNHTDIFKKLGHINDLRNRIAHHEPICFNTTGIICTVYALEHYNIMVELFGWLDVDAVRLLQGIDNVPQEVTLIDGLL